MKRILLILLLLFSNVAIAQPGAAFFFNSTISQSALDPDAEAFLTATGITDPTITTAIDNLVIAAKAHGWWAECSAIYPFVGGTSTTHKYNLKDPQDADGSFRITWNGTIIHSSDGVVSDGVESSYGNTHLNPFLELIQFDTHISYYSRTNITEESFDLASGDATFQEPRHSVHLRWSDNNLYSDQYSFTNGRIAQSNTNSIGYFIATRTANNAHVVYLDGSSFGSSSSTETGAMPNNPYHIFNSSGAPHNPSLSGTKQCAFITIGNGTDATMAADMNTDIEAFQDELGRGVQ